MLQYNPITLLGLVAGFFTTVAFVPQVIRTWRMRSAADLSLVMVSLNSAGVLLWLIYGLCIHSLPLIIANLFTFALTSAVLILAVKYR